MKEEASEAGVNADVGGLRLLDGAANDRRHVRAGGVVEGGAQLGLRSLREQSQGDGDQIQGQEKRAWVRHLVFYLKLILRGRGGVCVL